MLFNYPHETFHWAFFDENMNRHYINEKTVKRQIILFMVIAVSISCLGILGAVSYKADAKTKEICIRKVPGARMHQIARIMLNTLVRQVVIATIINFPVAYYLTEQYLLKFSEC